MRTRFTQKGVGLLEVLIAALVIGLGLLALGVFQGDLFNAATDSKARGLATKLAEEKLEDLKSFQMVEHPAGNDAADEFAFVDITGDGLPDGSGDADEIGGALKSTGGAYDPFLPDGTETNLSGVNFTRTWVVTNLYQPPVVDVNGNAVTDKAPVQDDNANWEDNGGDWGPLPALPDVKQVAVTITWRNPDSNPSDPPESVVVTGAIRNAPMSQAVLALESADGGMDPVVRYAPGQAPEVVDIPIDEGTGRALEATKPEPDVTEQAGSVMVKIEEVGYTNVGDEITLWRNSLLTLNCVCDPGRTLDTLNPALQRYPTVLRNIYDPTKIGDADIGGGVNQYGGWVLGDEESLKAAAATASRNARVGDDVLNLGQQPFECDVCCGSHQDLAMPASLDSTVGYVADPPFYDPQRPLLDADGNDLYEDPPPPGGDVPGQHIHFFPNNSGVLGPSGNGLYLEACRLIRVGGFWWATQDWNLVEVNIIPATFLVGDGTTAYQNYVKAVVAKYLDRSDWYEFTGDSAADTHPTRPWLSGDLATGGTLDNPAGLGVGRSMELMARAIYVDYMSPSLLTELAGVTDMTGTGSPYLPRVPFHEVNVTKLANWSVTRSVTTVNADGETEYLPTTDATVCDDPISNNAYCRGIVTGVSATPVDEPAMAWAIIEPSNSGITDTRAIDPDDQDFAANDPNDPSVSVYYFTVGAGGAEENNYVIRGNVTISANAGNVDYSDIVITGFGYDPVNSVDKSNSINCTKQNAVDGTLNYQCAIAIDTDTDGDTINDLAQGHFAIEVSGYNYLYKDSHEDVQTSNNEVAGNVQSGTGPAVTCVKDDGALVDTTQFGFRTEITDPSDPSTVLYVGVTGDTEMDLHISKDNSDDTAGTCLITVP